jgi:hypothetical protein
LISCTEFIPAYSELFKYIEGKGGKKAVNNFWEYLSDNYLTNLHDLVEKLGIVGCWEYWSKTLTEEASDFLMELDENHQEFKIEMYHCPSKGRLLESKNLEPYHDYCKHCDVLYARVLKPLGFDCITDLSEADKAKCSFHIKKSNIGG